MGSRVKNKAPASIQITAEQILREARELRDREFRPVNRKIRDSEELDDYRYGKRADFENQIRRDNRNYSVWIKYAQWEELQKDFNRARSVWERVLEASNYNNHSLWIQYADMEMKNKFINHARNLWDRAVQILPRVDQIWYKYIHMEEMLGNVAMARAIFQQWMPWMSNQESWLSYVKFELRYNEVDRARAVFELFVQCYPKVDAWMEYAKFETENGEIALARDVYERAAEKVAEEEDAELLFVAFAEFEEDCKEIERARCIYKFGISHVPNLKAENLYKKFLAFERRY